MWELLTQLYKRFGLWALLGVALLFGAIWAITHIVAQPCDKVSVLGVIEYKKACTTPLEPTERCQELRHLIERKNTDDARLVEEIAELQAQVKQGNHDAQPRLQNRMEHHINLQQDIRNLKAQLQAQCPGQ